MPDQLPSEIYVRIGRASEVIVDAAKDEDATLIVMGHGANAARVVNHADRSVYVVR